MKIRDLFERLGADIFMLSNIVRILGEDYERLVQEFLKASEHDTAGMRDRLEVEVVDSNGNIKYRADTGWSRNGITNVGKAEIARLIGAGLGGTAFNHIAIGVGTTPFDANQTALAQEIRRKVATVGLETTNTPNDTVVFEATFSKDDGLTGSHAITESGVFNSPTGGVMLCRQVFPQVNLNWDNGDRITIRWRIVVQQA